MLVERQASELGGENNALSTIDETSAEDTSNNHKARGVRGEEAAERNQKGKTKSREKSEEDFGNPESPVRK